MRNSFTEVPCPPCLKDPRPNHKSKIVNRKSNSPSIQFPIYINLVIHNPRPIHFRHFGGPTAELRFEARGVGGTRSGQVLRFAFVGLQVVQICGVIQRVDDELEIPHAQARL